MLTLENATYFIIAVYVIYGVILPVLGWNWVKWNKSSEENNPIWIEMMRPELVRKTKQSFDGLLAQAVGEKWITWVICLLISAPVAVYFSNPFIAGVGPFIISLALNKFTPVYKQIDLIGRALETVVALPFYPNYLKDEAAKLIKGHRGNFTNPNKLKYTAEQWQRVVEDKIEARFGIAYFLRRLLKKSWA